MIHTVTFLLILPPIDTGICVSNFPGISRALPQSPDPAGSNVRFDSSSRESSDLFEFS
jgi:hypothetical protein